MKDPKKTFHYISYLQYPLMLIGLFYCYKPLFGNLDMIWADLNKGLIFFGLGISFSTLQDTTKTQNKISRRIFEKPTYAKAFLVLIFVQVLFFILLGMFGLFLSEKTPVNELSFGIISIGIGFIGVLKSAVEMAHHHRKVATEFVTTTHPASTE
jgi:magnesium-transporting ATPase (P-type)